MSERRGHTSEQYPGLLSLCQETGRGVFDAGGMVIGYLADLSVDLDRQVGPPLVERLLVKRRRAPDLLLPWAVVAEFAQSGIVLAGDVETSSALGPAAEELGRNEILLARDVLDTQIVDVAGLRLARVADIALSKASNGTLEVIGVEVGFDAILRRLKLPYLAARVRRDVVAWTDLHLTSERGHTIQLATPRSAVHHLDAVQLAALVDRLDVDTAAEVLAVAAPDLAAGAIDIADPAVGERVLRASSGADTSEILAAMPAGHATRWHARLARTPAYLGRHFLRSRVWPRHHRTRSGYRS